VTTHPARAGTAIAATAAALVALAGCTSPTDTNAGAEPVNPGIAAVTGPLPAPGPAWPDNAPQTVAPPPGTGPATPTPAATASPTTAGASPVPAPHAADEQREAAAQSGPERPAARTTTSTSRRTATDPALAHNPAPAAPSLRPGIVCDLGERWGGWKPDAGVTQTCRNAYGH
jgi:hypothetical protein